MLNAARLAAEAGNAAVRSILLVDERPLMIECMTGVLSSGLGEVSITGCPNVALAQAAIESGARPDLIVLGIGIRRMIDRVVIDQVHQLTGMVPGVAMLILSDLCDDSVPGEVKEASRLRMGRISYMQSSTPVEVMVAAVHLILVGGTYIPAAALGHDFDEMDPSSLNGNSGLLAMTPREVEILHRLREGKPNKIIARELSLSVGTVEAHVSRILHKLRANSRSQVAYIINRLQPETSVGRS
jgi:DNA-binding NarL/FixJ family response regulator